MYVGVRSTRGWSFGGMLLFGVVEGEGCLSGWDGWVDGWGWEIEEEEEEG